MAIPVFGADEVVESERFEFEAPEYEPGVCNIGTAEIERRRKSGYAGLAAAGGLLAGLVLLRAPRPTRLLVAIPTAVGAAGFIQARERFCAGFGSRGVYNFGDLGDETQVLDPTDAALDRSKSMQIGGASAVIGIAAGIAAVLLPIG